MRLVHQVVALTLAWVPGMAAQEKVKVDLYVMSLCPFGVQAENGILPAAKSLKEHMELNLLFIGNDAPGAEGKPQFTSLHGEPEVRENIRQVCAMKLYPDKYMDYILERNKSYKGIDWRAPAKFAGMDPDRLELCFKGAEGERFYLKNLEANRTRGANASPTIDIDGRPYARGRSQAAVTVAVCDAMKSKGIALPKACEEARLAAANDPGGVDGGCGEPAQAPGATAPPVSFDIRIVTEQSCKLCEPTLLDNMAKLHPSAKIKTLDIASKEGQDLIRLHGAKTLPLYVLDAKVEQEANFSRLLPVAYYKSLDSYLIRHGPTNFYPSVQLERAAARRHMDVFFESLNALSAQAEADFIRFLLAEQASLKDLTFSVHFLAAESIVENAAKPAEVVGGSLRTASLAELPKVGAPTSLTSPRGIFEVDEDARQLCLFQHTPIGTFFTYLSCRNQALADPQQAERCLQPSERVKRCIESGEGKNLLRRDVRLAQDLGLNRAPAFLWENRYGPFGFNEADWRNLLKGRKEPTQRPNGGPKAQ